MKQFGKFIVIGILSNIVNFSIYLSLIKISIRLFYATLIGYFFGLFISYLGSKLWTFKEDEKIGIFQSINSIIKFILIYGFSGVGMAYIVEASSAAGIEDDKICWLIGAVFAVSVNYLGQKYFVFSQKQY